MNTGRGVSTTAVAARAGRAARRRISAYRSLLSQLPALRREAQTLRGATADGGWLRGVDFYTPVELRQALMRVFMQFHYSHGCYPNLVEPHGFNEWVVRSDFLRYLKVPESGNKLLTATFIPERLKSSVRCPPILWSGPRLDRTAPDQLPPGKSYYLKAANGSSMFTRFSWPLTEWEKRELTAVSTGWLKVKYGFKYGEWWYSASPPMLLIESDVGGNGFSVNCFCFRGSVGLVVLHSKGTGETITLSGRFELLGHRNGQSDWCELFGTAVLREISALAGELSRDLEFARFDFLVGDEREIFLGEVTFAPGNGNSTRPDGVDERLGRMWSASASC